MTIFKKLLSWREKLFYSQDAASLGLFRIAFGIVLIAQSFSIYNTSFVKENFIENSFHFPFALFNLLGLTRWPEEIMHIHFLIMGLAAIGITLGLFFRFSAITFFLTLSYVFLFDKTMYNDCHYLMLLLSFLLMFSPAHRWLSLDRLWNKNLNKINQIPFFSIYLLRMQFVIVYFYAAITKINVDWLIAAQPLQRVIEGKMLFGISLDHLWLAYFFSYTGLLLDLFMSLSLFTGRYIKLTIAFILTFNLTNHFLLFNDIGVFPFLMISAIPLFLKPNTPRIWWQNTQKFLPLTPDNKENLDTLNPAQKTGIYRLVITIFVTGFILIQLLVPLRHFLYPGKPVWTYEGARFAWRLKLNAKKTNMKIIIHHPQLTTRKIPDYTNFLTYEQRWIDNLPDCLLDFVHLIRDDLESHGFKKPKIHIKAEASLNERPYQPFIDETVNLAHVEYPLFSHAEWIVPFREGRGKK